MADQTFTALSLQGVQRPSSENADDATAQANWDMANQDDFACDSFQLPTQRVW